MSDLMPLQMLSATVDLNCEAEGWNLHLPVGGARQYIHEVAFETVFSSIPVVHVALSGFDIGNQDAGRIKVNAVAIHPGGFSLEIETWRHTRVYGVQVSWLAVGSM